jgi:hypothetical protein
MIDHFRVEISLLSTPSVPRKPLKLDSIQFSWTTRETPRGIKCVEKWRENVNIILCDFAAPLDANKMSLK